MFVNFVDPAENIFILKTLVLISENIFFNNKDIFFSTFYIKVKKYIYFFLIELLENHDTDLYVRCLLKKVFPKKIRKNNKNLLSVLYLINFKGVNLLV